MDNKTIYLLVGPKGSGKSFIGHLVEQQFGIKFIRVEAWAKQVKRSRDYDDPAYLREVFNVIETGIRETLRSNDQIIFESTGLTKHFDRMLMNLKNDYEVITIGVYATEDVCVERIKSRDKTIHIDISDKNVIGINQRVRQKKMQTDFLLVNESMTAEELTSEISKLLEIA